MGEKGFPGTSHNVKIECQIEYQKSLYWFYPEVALVKVEDAIFCMIPNPSSQSRSSPRSASDAVLPEVMAHTESRDSAGFFDSNAGLHLLEA